MSIIILCGTNEGDNVEAIVGKDPLLDNDIKDSYEGENVDESHGKLLWKVKDNARPFMRHEMLKIAS